MKKIVITALILFAAAGALISQDIESLGYNILSTGTDDGYNVITAEDPSSGLIFDLYYTDFTQSQLYFLQEARKIVLSWKYIIPETLQIIFDPQVAEISVVPATFIYNEHDYAQYIPSTINFYFEDILEYDFRILVENITLRVRGPYFNEKQLADKLQNAVANPIAYIQSNDPEYIVRRLGEIAGELEELKAGQSAGETERKKLRRQVEVVTAKYRQLQLGIIAVANQGLFSSIKDFNKSEIEQAIALKEDNPSYTEDQLLAACKEQDISVTGKEIHIIFMVYFNEF